MLQAELMRMEEQATGTERLFERAVELKGTVNVVPQDREMPAGRLHSDLVRLTRDEIDFEE